MSIIKEILRLTLAPFRQKRIESIARSSVNRLTSDSTEIKLELGSGAKRGVNGWTTLDQNNNCDIPWDLRKGIPFPDNSVAMIYSSHLFEHLDFSSGQMLLQECLRVLRPSGEFSICVPDAKPYVEAYMSKDLNFLHARAGYYKPAYNNTTAIDILNYVAYMDGQHKYMFDLDNLLKIIEKSGFKNVRARDFNAELDIMERDHDSIYATAQK